MFILPIIFSLAVLFFWMFNPSGYNSLVGQHMLGLFMDYNNMRHDFQTIWSLFTVVFFVVIAWTFTAILAAVQRAEEAEQAQIEPVVGIDWGRTDTPHKGIGKTHRWAVKPELLDATHKVKKTRRKTS